MTHNQIDYQKLVEERRHNAVSEAETERNNRAVLNETNRANIVREMETERSNRAKEHETGRHNVITENQNQLALAENAYHNRQQEAIGKANARAAIANANTNARNADTNEANAATNSRNADTNAAHASRQDMISYSQTQGNYTNTLNQADRWASQNTTDRVNARSGQIRAINDIIDTGVGVVSDVLRSIF